MDLKAEVVLKNIRKEIKKIRDRNRKIKNRPYAENTMVMIGLMKAVEIVEELRNEEMEKLIDWRAERKRIVSN
jgi:cysteine sulfinate desulfinase/cysteine desulfurase-like protein